MGAKKKKKVNQLPQKKNQKFPSMNVLLYVSEDRVFGFFISFSEINLKSMRGNL